MPTRNVEHTHVIDRHGWEILTPAQRVDCMQAAYGQLAQALARTILGEQLARCRIATTPSAIKLTLTAKLSFANGGERWLTSEEVAPSSHDSERTSNPAPSVGGYGPTVGISESTGTIGALPRGNRERDDLESSGVVVPYASANNYSLSAFVDGVRRDLTARTPSDAAFPDDNSLGHTDTIHAELRGAGYDITPNTNRGGNSVASAGSVPTGGLTATEISIRDTQFRDAELRPPDSCACSVCQLARRQAAARMAGL